MNQVTKPQPMTAWYDPRRLISIGIHVAEATIFGRMFDRRELMASLDPFDQNYFDQNFDFSEAAVHASKNFSQAKYCEPNGDFWLDFAADTGDGWHSTYAVARLLARKQLRIQGVEDPLPQGRVLVFGGDQVYPTASKEDYEAKLKKPFDAANEFESKKDPDSIFNPATRCFPGRHLFAVPGNHDWYDDLTSFTALFCNKAPDRPGAVRSPGRNVCGRSTAQTRSYFALKLPHNWWLCAFDAQLEGYIDAPQLRFFEYVAQNLMEPGSNVILSVAGPVWAYSRDREAQGFSNFAFASLIVTGAIDYPAYKPERQHNLRLVLTGDAHHYAHFKEEAKDTKAVVDYLTCGLGGAFLHPTHWLRNTTVKVQWPPPPPLQKFQPGAAQRQWSREFKIAPQVGKKEEAIYPDRERSSCMTWWNLAFLYFNFSFGAFIGAVGAFAAWLLHFGARVLDTDLATYLGGGSLSRGLSNLFWLMVHTPWPWLIVGAIFAALRYFADFEKGGRKTWIGAAHTAAHVVVFLAALFIAARFLPDDFWIVIAAGAATIIAAPTIMGIYLLIMLNGFHVHWEEAYSALRIAGYKGFLRLRITAAGDLEVYPIVIDKVPSEDAAELNARVFDGPIKIQKTS